jgi:hypothetical protein
MWYAHRMVSETGASAATVEAMSRPKAVSLSRANRTPFLAMLGATFVLAVAACSPGQGQAQVQVLAGAAVDWTTRQPIAGAKVVFDCSADATNRIEGHDHLRTVTHLTDSDGRYEFSSNDLRGCTLFRFVGSKEGYSGSYPSGEDVLAGRHIPRLLILVKQSDQAFFDLQGRAPDPNLHVRFANTGAVDALGDYHQWYRAFFEAKRIATTDREIAFVRQQFCAHLEDLFAKLSYEDKLSLEQSPVSFAYDGKSWTGRMSDYDKEVVPYCSSP